MSNPIIMDILRNALYNMKNGFNGIAEEQLLNVIKLIDQQDKGLWDEVSQEDLKTLEDTP